jgi:hypothetical protein
MRDEQLLRQLRPDLQLPLQSSKPDECFQNQTLRPILKMQHALLVQLFATHIRKRKNVFFKLSAPAQMEWITNAVRADQRFRNLLVGTVVGHFSLDELAVFEANEAECLRRLVNLIIQRLQSVDFEELMGH